VQERPVLSWCIYREGRGVLQTFTAAGISNLIHLPTYKNNGSHPW